MCKTSNAGTRTAAPASEQLRVIEKPAATPIVKVPGLFPTAYTLLTHTTNTTSLLYTGFETVRAKTKYKKLPFALIDYTSTQPVYFGNRDREQTFVASLAKIGVLFAALWLRKTVRENARNSTATSLTAVLDELEVKWSQVEKPFPTRFKKNVVPSKTWPPNLKEIFTGTKLPGGEWSLDFTSAHDFVGAGRAASLLILAPIDEMPEGSTASKNAKRTAVNNLGFRERLELMTGWSNNLAAASCINALGYQFLNGSLMNAGLYDDDKTTGGGLWISKNYDGVQDGSDFQQVTAQAATAQVAANCMWLAANNQLIDAAASADWLLIMDKQTYTNMPNPVPSYTRSFIGDELYGTRNLVLTRLNSKIGIYYLKKKVNGQDVYYGFRYSDVANVAEAENNGTVLKYVIAICFSGTTDATTKVLQDLSWELTGVIKAAYA